MSMIPQMEPWFDQHEREAIDRYMSGGGWLTEFELTREFERQISELTGAEHCVATNNGTISLTLAAIAAGVKAGDDVLVPNYTQIATPNSVYMINANPVFVDVEPDTLCMDVAMARAAITPKTRALMLVSANGRYPKAGIEAFVSLCDEFGLVLIEDAAQSLGCRYPDGRHVGTVGRIGSFSFSVPKIITTGQGGALITNDDEMAAHLRKLKDFGRSGGGNDIHDTIGYNFKFTDLQAAIGIEQMKKLPHRIALKRQIYSRYAQHLDGVKGVQLLPFDLAHGAPWFIDTMVERREELVLFLKERGVGSRVMYPPINAQKAYARLGSYPVSEAVGSQGLWLPSAAQLTPEAIDRVCQAIRAFYDC